MTTPPTPTPAPEPAPVKPAGPTLAEKLLLIFKTEPALVTNLLGTAAALIAAFGTGATQGAEAAVVTIASALITIVTALYTRPVRISVITGAVVTGLTAAAAFGLHLGPDVLALVASTLGYLLPGLLLRIHLTPTVSLAALRGNSRIHRYQF